jgi:hypothetical protein
MKIRTLALCLASLLLLTTYSNAILFRLADSNQIQGLSPNATRYLHTFADLPGISIITQDDDIGRKGIVFNESVSASHYQVQVDYPQFIRAHRIDLNPNTTLFFPREPGQPLQISINNNNPEGNRQTLQLDFETTLLSYIDSLYPNRQVSLDAQQDLQSISFDHVFYSENLGSTLYGTCFDGSTNQERVWILAFDPDNESLADMVNYAKSTVVENTQ